MDFRKIRSGDPISSLSSSAINAMLDATVAFQQGNGAGALPPRAAQKNTGVILVQNKTDADLPALSLVQIDKPSVLPDADEQQFRLRIVLDVVKATAAKLPWMITQEAIAKDATGIAVVSGYTLCQINLIAKTDDRVDSGTGLTLPQSGTSGPAAIVWVKGGVKTAAATGTQWAVIQLGGGSGAAGTGIGTWMKVKTATGSDLVAIANSWDGTTAGSSDIPVRMAVPAKAGMTFQALQTNKTGQSSGGHAVTWIELVLGDTEDTASPLLIGDSVEGSESPDTLAGSTGADNKPVNIYIQTREVFDDGGDEKLYQMRRKIMINSRGLVYAEPAEVRIETDEPIDCGDETVSF